MEFLRFGSSIPGEYWGCCACDIIQNFNEDPDTPASIQLVEGDGGSTLGKFAGKTYRDIFLQRLVYGTFSADPARAKNHAFIAILSAKQCNTAVGKKWLRLLKAQGFEFVRSVNNSVWNAKNYIFMMVRNVGPNAIDDQFAPPPFWEDLPSRVPEARSYLYNGGTIPGIEITTAIKEAQKPLYDALPQGVFYTEEDLKKEGIPITYAGVRSTTSHYHGRFQIGYPQQSAAERERYQAAAKTLMKPAENKPSAFPQKAVMATPPVAQS